MLEDSSSDCLSIRSETMIGSEPFRMSFLYSARAASRASLATVMMVCLFSAASAEEAYICIPIASGGVRFDEATKRWLGTSLKTNDEKYIVRQPKVDEKKYAPDAKWAVFSYFKPEKQYIRSMCEGDFYPNGLLRCGPFEMNRVNLRFLNIESMGYVTVLGSEGSDTPNIEIGMCSPI